MLIIQTRRKLADSSGRRNGLIVGRLQQLVKRLSGCPPVESFTWPRIEGGRHGSDLVGAMSAEVRALREVLPQQSVGVLVRAALPRAVRVAEVDLNTRVDRQAGVLAISAP